MADKAKNRDKRRTTRLSHIVKPDGMDLRTWQIKLRRQMAGKERLLVSCADEELSPGEYMVCNPATANTYKVVYRGASSAWNYCSCLDFKTSRLGTCKHIEAVKLWLGHNSRQHVHRELPPYTSVYLSYRGERQVCIRIGAEHREQFKALAKAYFDSDGVLRDEAYAVFGEFLALAHDISDTFRCYKDALDFVVSRRDRQLHIALADKYDDERLNRLLRVPLYPYQKEGIRFAIKAGKAIIADEMGLGKTIQAIGVAEVLRREGLVETILILCPTSLKYQWQSEIRKFTGADVCVVEGSHLARKEAYNRSEPYKIVSYNSACNDIKILGALRTDMLIMDEVQRLKNWDTQIARAARKIDSDYAVVLSGTPLENKLEELYSIVELVDNYRLSPYYLFRDRYIIQDETGKVEGYQNLNEIGQRLSDILIRRRKCDVQLQMPERIDKNLFISMTHEQREMHAEWQACVYRLVQKWRRMHFLSDTDRKRLLLMLSQMRMVCDSTYVLDQRTRYDTKVGECLNLIDDVIGGSDGKVVVFSQWERMTRLVARALTERGIRFEYLHGGVPSAKRKSLVDNFTHLPDSRVFLSTDAGSTGLNLQVASTLINIDLPWNPAVLEQRVGRIYRIGQRNNIQVINLVTPNSIEEAMLGKLRFKSSMFEGVFDSGADSVFVDNCKFDKVMETVSGIMEDVEATVSDGVTPSVAEAESAEPIAASSDAVLIDDGDMEPARVDSVPSQGTSLIAADVEHGATGRPEKQRTPQAPRELVSQGMSFLSGLADTLKSPEATARLIDTIVECDEHTGATSIRIPVESKETVASVFRLIGRLLG